MREAALSVFGFILIVILRTLRSSLHAKKQEIDRQEDGFELKYKVKNAFERRRYIKQRFVANCQVFRCAFQKPLSERCISYYINKHRSLPKMDALWNGLAGVGLLAAVWPVWALFKPAS